MKKYSPKTANTPEKILSLRSDNVNGKNHWILTDHSTVTIGCGGSGRYIEIPKSDFNKFIRWYHRETLAPRYSK